MDRAGNFFMDKNDENTYFFDESLPSLPLPALKDTMGRYYESLKPFGNSTELLNARKIIEEFENGVGRELHEKLVQRAEKLKKNWLGNWWEKYGYYTLRGPLYPYTVMAQPLILECVGVPETPELFLKNLARVTYFTIEFWELLYKSRLKPPSSPDGKIKYSAAQYKRFFSTCRIPGTQIDRFGNHFRIAAEGDTPTHGMISGKGRLFVFDTVHADGSIITQGEVLVILQRVRSILDYEPMGDCVPVLTHDERKRWAMNRQHLQEISVHNAKTLKLVESSNIVLIFDENEPQSYEEASLLALNGDYHSKWGDRCSIMIAYKNGRFALTGEHSAYDGSVSISYVLYLQLSLYEVPEPKWLDSENGTANVSLRELKFDLDPFLKTDIERMLEICEKRRSDIVVTYTVFEDFGKERIKNFRLNPDSFVQVLLQLAYAKMEQSIASIYETALMRHFYNGRTETLRSCTTEVHKFINIALNENSSKADIVGAFRAAAVHHNYMMNEARKGHGVDRHLFGLWCIAHENNIDIPRFYEEPLYLKSGGGGNFILSTSTLGYTVNVGFVAPMILDGYGVFYSITAQAIHFHMSAFRKSSITSVHKFKEIFMETLKAMETLLSNDKSHKL